MADLEYHYLSANAPPRREDRLGACNAFGGSCSSLEQKAKCGCLKNAKRSFSQTQGCQLYLASSIINTMIHTVIVVHGPVGCGSANILSAGTTRVVQRQRDPNATGLQWISTCLDESDVISGGEQKLIEAVRYADREFRPQAILVVNTCVPSIIGDDIDNILSKLNREVNAKIVPIHCEGFKSKIMATAYDSVYHGILSALLEKRAGDDDDDDDRVLIDEVEDFKERLRISKTVNVFNVSSMSRPDELELTRLLTAVGLNVRMYPCYSHPDDFEDISEAALNVSICPTHDDYFSGHLEEIYGIPYMLRTIPIGMTNIRKWVLDIAEFFNLGDIAERIVEDEEKALRSALQPYRKLLEGKKVYIAGGEIRVLATAQFLKEDLGMEIVGMKGYHYDRFADELVRDFAQKEDPGFSAATGQPFEQANLIERLKPDLYIGHVGLNGWAGRQGLPVFPVFMVSANYMGYSGAFELARRISRILKNNRFNRNLYEHMSLPYRKEWYVRDAFGYIVEE
jgi:nitrogenase molybdenum-iron protein alpha chain